MKNILDDIYIVYGSFGVLRLKDYKKAGRFTPYLTEHASLTIRLYLNGFKEVYIRDWVEYGQNLPPNFNMTLKTIRRWQTGTFDVNISNFWKILFNKNLKFKQKISFIHMFSTLFLPLISFILMLISNDNYSIQFFIILIVLCSSILLFLTNLHNNNLYNRILYSWKENI